MTLNIQEMAASAYNILTQIQNSAAEIIGLDTLWCRATPEPNSEDVVLQEYTLTNIGVECPQQIKVITTNGDYNPGNYTIDLFGVNYDSPLEVNVTVDDWKKTFGDNSMPQQGDVVYIKILHKLFEVRSSQVMYSIASMPTYYKCQLSKYNPTASRRTTEELQLSIDELTVSQEELFGETISNEVADAVAEEETSYNHTTYTDPLKDFDFDCVTFDPLVGPHGNIISNAYYNFSIASQDVVYHVPAHYYIDSDRTHWIFTCWFRSDDDTTVKEYNVKSLFLYHKDKKFWYFKIGTMMKMSVGDIITLKRGRLITVQGEVVELPNEQTLGIRFKYSDMSRLSKKLSNWYESGSFKINKSSQFNIISSDNDSMFINISPDEAQIHVKFGNIKKDITFKKQPDFAKWSYMCIDFSPNNLRAIISQINCSGTGEMFMDNILDNEYKSATNAGEFDFESLIIKGMETSLNIRNIRLYENEYPIEDKYEQDMFSEISRNASKMILVDAPNVKDGKPFISPAR